MERFTGLSLKLDNHQQRKNQYRAEINIAPIGGVWKLADLEIL